MSAHLFYVEPSDLSVHGEELELAGMSRDAIGWLLILANSLCFVLLVGFAFSTFHDTKLNAEEVAPRSSNPNPHPHQRGRSRATVTRHFSLYLSVSASCSPHIGPLLSDPSAYFFPSLPLSLCSLPALPTSLCPGRAHVRRRPRPHDRAAAAAGDLFGRNAWLPCLSQPYLDARPRSGEVLQADAVALPPPVAISIQTFTDDTCDPVRSTRSS